MVSDEFFQKDKNNNPIYSSVYNVDIRSCFLTKFKVSRRFCVGLGKVGNFMGRVGSEFLSIWSKSGQNLGSKKAIFKVKSAKNFGCTP